MAESFPKIGWGFSKSGKLTEAWPKDPDGEPVASVFLMHCNCTDLEDELTVNLLEAYGIPCVRRFPNNGDLGRVMLGMSGTGVDLYVPETLLEDAKALISEDCAYDDDDEQ